MHKQKNNGESKAVELTVYPQSSLSDLPRAPVLLCCPPHHSSNATCVIVHNCDNSAQTEEIRGKKAESKRKNTRSQEAGSVYCTL